MSVCDWSMVVTLTVISAHCAGGGADVIDVE